MSTLVAQPAAPAVLEPLGQQLKVKSAQVTLDEAWSPYAQGTIVCEIPTGADRAAVDLREQPLRVSLQLRRDFGVPWDVADLTALVGGSVAALTALSGGLAANITHALYVPWTGSVERPADLRDFDLYVRERLLDDNSKEMTLTVTSDEALLLGDGLAAAAPLNPGTTDLATIVSGVLARHGASLAPDSLTATVAESAATIWQPGVTASDYLNSLLEAASLRLWCDERRAWRISARESMADGSLAVSPAVMTKHQDSMTLDTNVWADAVVVKYSWTDAAGASQVAYDPAGAQPAKALLPVERPNTVYPGPGAATGILTRLQGRGRVLTLSMDTDLSASPGQSMTVTPPDTVALAGFVSSVVFRFPDDEMDISSRGLTDIPTDSYLFGDDTTFADVAVSAPTLAINAFDWSLV